MEEKDVVKLSDGNKYMVVKKATLSDGEYVYMLKIGDEADFLLFKVEKDGLEEVESTVKKLEVLECMNIMNENK